jgi:hypothetical protein
MMENAILTASKHLPEQANDIGYQRETKRDTRAHAHNGHHHGDNL